MEHHHIWHDDFKITGSNYASSFKGKVSEALFIKQFKSTPTKKEQSIQLQLCKCLIFKCLIFANNDLPNVCRKDIARMIFIDVSMLYQETFLNLDLKCAL